MRDSSRHLLRTLLLQWLALVFLLCAAQQSQKLRPPHSSEDVKRRAEDADRWNNEGLRLFAEGKFSRAAEAFEKVYALFPKIADVAYNLGLAYQQAGKFEESISPLHESVTLRPGDSSYRRALGVSLLNVDRLQEGARQLEKSLQGDSKNVDTLYYLALAYYRMKEYDQAEKCLGWMFERNPDSALLHLRTANVHRINRRYQEALAELEKARALDPDLPGLYLELGATYVGLRDAQAALAALEEEIRRHPGSAEAHLTLGEMFLAVNHDYKRALQSIQQAQELGVQPVRAEFDLGDAYVRLNQLDNAQCHLEQAIKLDPGHRRAHYLLARIYQRQGESSKARAHFAVAESLRKQEKAELEVSFRSVVEDEEGAK